MFAEATMRTIAAAQTTKLDHPSGTWSFSWGPAC